MGYRSAVYVIRKTFTIILLVLMMIFYPDAQLDFHDRGSLLPYDIEKLYNEFIEDSIIDGHNQLLIITGKGKVVRPLVQKLLRQDKRVKRFEIASYHTGQDGAFEVWV